ncbi:MAG: choice-of-anchor D domain-containing protein, partial [Calditrichaeota bacterium]
MPPLVAQPAIESVEKIEVVAGKPAVLTLRGKNFREIRRIDQVRIGDQDAEVLDWVIFNDQAMRLEIRIPSDLAQGVHSLSLRIYTANAEQWLEAQFPGRSSSGPEIELSYNNVSIVNGQSAPVTVELSHTGAPPILEFLLANRGDAPLDLGEPALPDWLTPAEAFPQQVGVGKSTFFFLQVQGTPGNTYRGMVEFTNNDPDENPFRFPLQVTIVSPPTPRLEILLEGLSPLSGPLATVRFGSGTVGAVMQKTLTIKNSGTALLSLSNPTLPPGFRLIEPFPTRVAVGEEIALPIALNTDQPGGYEGTMTFQTNDPAWSPVRIHLIGRVTTEPTPQAEVWQGTRPVAGESSAMVSFDTTEVGMPIARTFTLRNIGAAPLAVSDFRVPPGFRIME